MTWPATRRSLRRQNARALARLKEILEADPDRLGDAGKERSI